MAAGCKNADRDKCTGCLRFVVDMKVLDRYFLVLKSYGANEFEI